MAIWGAGIAEFILGIFAIGAILIIFILRTPDPEELLPEPLPQAGPAKPLEIEVTSDMLDDSRYMS